jgi:hypothetical protein
MSPYC